MIHDHDRSGWFGASDVSYIVGNWGTKTFESWWRTKQGFEVNNFTNDAMLAGTYKERQILESLELPMIYDRQIKLEPIRLRVNLDGEYDDTVYECKTYKLDNGFKVPKKYVQQVNVQMYATGFRKAYIVAYGLKDNDYKNFYLDIDKDRLQTFEIQYDEKWIEEEFLPKVQYLAECLIGGRFPMKEDYGRRNSDQR